MAVPKDWARDFFLSLAHSALLFAIVGHFGSLLFSYIDTAESGSRYISNFTWNLAVLIVMVPAFLVLRHWIEWVGSAVPSEGGAVRHLIGKWSWFLLFVSGGAVLADLAYLLYLRLEGGLFWAFGMKMAVVLLLGLLVFSYAWYAKWHGNIGWRPAFSATIAAIMVTIALGFFAGEPPSQRRKETADMNTIQIVGGWHDAVQGHYDEHSQLPRRLEEVDTRPWFALGDLRDQPWPEYRILNDRTYVLCAEFQTLHSYGKWTHHAGKECFVETASNKE